MQGHPLRFFLVTAVLLPLLASSVAAQPDPANSFFEQRLTVSPRNLDVLPGGAFVYRGTLLDNAGFPVVGFPASQVVLDFNQCLEPTSRPFNLIPADADSDVNGEVVWTSL